MGSLTTLYPAPASNNILEMLSGVADGRTVTVLSGTYTFQNVTAGHSLSTSYSDLPGSAITYTPPEGAKYVLYKFSYKSNSASLNYGSSGIHHTKLFIDGTDVYRAHKSVSGNYSGSHSNNHANFTSFTEYVFDLTAASDDLGQGKLNGWTTGKLIKCQGRDYSSPYYQADIHKNDWEDGSGASGEEVYTKPTIKIIAYK
jgi:hypothetical protein